MALEVVIEMLPGNEDLELPVQKTTGSAGFDLSAAVSLPLTINSGCRALVPLGFRLVIPFEYEAQIRPRSGIAIDNGITVLNSPGTIDSDFRGELGVILINHGDQEFIVQRGDRIAQLIISRIMHVRFVRSKIQRTTDRGHSGFGSTG